LRNLSAVPCGNSGFPIHVFFRTFFLFHCYTPACYLNAAVGVLRCFRILILFHIHYTVNIFSRIQSLYPAATPFVALALTTI
jgi:hypothetical protein